MWSSLFQVEVQNVWFWSKAASSFPRRTGYLTWSSASWGAACRTLGPRGRHVSQLLLLPAGPPLILGFLSSSRQALNSASHSWYLETHQDLEFLTISKGRKALLRHLRQQCCPRAGRLLRGVLALGSQGERIFPSDIHRGDSLPQSALWASTPPQSGACRPEGGPGQRSHRQMPPSLARIALGFGCSCLSIPKEFSF